MSDGKKMVVVGVAARSYGATEGTSGAGRTAVTTAARSQGGPAPPPGEERFTFASVGRR